MDFEDRGRKIEDSKLIRVLPLLRFSTLDLQSAIPTSCEKVRLKSLSRRIKVTPSELFAPEHSRHTEGFAIGLRRVLQGGFSIE